MKHCRDTHLVFPVPSAYSADQPLQLLKRCTLLFGYSSEESNLEPPGLHRHDSSEPSGSYQRGPAHAGDAGKDAADPILRDWHLHGRCGALLHGRHPHQRDFVAGIGSEAKVTFSLDPKQTSF